MKLIILGFLTLLVPMLLNARIIGGQPVVDNAWDSVVALVDKDGDAYCSGVLIHPKIIITAAHCILMSENMGLQIHIGNGSQSGHNLTIITNEIISKKHYPEFSLQKQGAIKSKDLGYILLKNPIENITIVPILTDYDEILENVNVGSKITLVGFGIDGATFVGGKKIKVDTSINDRTEGISRHEVPIGSCGASGAPGDSGGPAFIHLSDGLVKLLGITSRGGNPCKGSTGIYSKLAASLCWVAKDTGLEIEGALDHCYSDLYSYSNEDYLNLEFQDICEISKTFGEKHTIDLLKIKFEANNCRELQSKLLLTQSLDLSDLSLFDVAPLVPFSNIKTINLSSSEIRVLRPLVFMSGLEKINIDFDNLDYSEISDFHNARPEVEFDFSKAGKQLSLAAIDANLDLISFLLNNGSDINNTDYEKAAPLLHAAWRKNADVAKFLLENKANINAADTGEGMTALMLAVMQNDHTMAALLMKWKINAKIKNIYKERALDIAIRLRYRDMEKRIKRYMGLPEDE